MPMTENVLAMVMQIVQPFVDRKFEITPDLPLLETGALDSASMVNILLALEERLGIQLSAADLAFDHFQSCRTLADALSTRT